MGSNPTRSANFFIEIPCKAQCFTGDSVFRPDSPYLEARVVVAELEKKYLGYSSDIRLVESIIGCQTAHALLDDTNSASQTTLAYLNSWIKSREHKIETKERDGKAVKQFLDSLGRGRDMPLTKINMGMAQDFMDKELERISNGRLARWTMFTSNLLSDDIGKNIDVRIASRMFRGDNVVCEVEHAPDFCFERYKRRSKR